MPRCLMGKGCSWHLVPVFHFPPCALCPFPITCLYPGRSQAPSPPQLPPNGCCAAAMPSSLLLGTCLVPQPFLRAVPCSALWWWPCTELSQLCCRTLHCPPCVRDGSGCLWFLLTISYDFQTDFSILLSLYMLYFPQPA